MNMRVTTLREHRPPAFGSGCPDPELLACFIDGRTTSAERAAVESHLARCEDCYFAFSETIQVQRASDEVIQGATITRRTRRLRPRIFSALAAAAALVLAVQSFRPGLAPNDRYEARLTSALGRLDEAMGEHRPVQSRLSAGAAYRPVEPPRRAGTAGDEAPLAVREAIVALEREAMAGGSSVEARRAMGLMYLMTGRSRRAVEILAPMAERSQDARVLSDTAAAWLARRDPGDALRARDVAERAVVADPGNAEAWFNLGLAAKAVGRPWRAVEAWTQYLTIDATSGWADEARGQIEWLMRGRRPEVRSR
jgi:tetratricopeptide (TPR) repeat protein